MTENGLVLERRGETDRTIAMVAGLVNAQVMMTPAIDQDYWSYRVRIVGEQAVVGFPKFGTIGIGFAQEEDWNTNLPYSCDTQKILDHIWHNRGESVPNTNDSRIAVFLAIQMIQQAVQEDRDEDDK